MALTAEQLAEIQARVDAAAPGPWHATDHTYEQLRQVVNDGVTFEASFGHIRNGHLAEAQFVAHARQDVPLLLAEVARLKAELDESSPRAFCQCCVFGNHDMPCTCARVTCCHPERHDAESAEADQADLPLAVEAKNNPRVQAAFRNLANAAVGLHLSLAALSADHPHIGAAAMPLFPSLAEQAIQDGRSRVTVPTRTEVKGSPA